MKNYRENNVQALNNLKAKWNKELKKLIAVKN